MALWSRLTAALRRDPRVAGLRLLRLNVLARRDAHQDFTPFVQPAAPRWRDALAAAKQGPKVLLATNIGGQFSLATVDRALAVALTLRGANVVTSLCDGVLPACQMTEIGLVPDAAAFARSGPPKALCSYCFAPAAKRLADLALPVLPLGACVTPAMQAEAARLAATVPREEIAAFTLDGIPVGEHALAGTLRYFAKGELAGEPHGEAVLRRYLSATILTARAYDALMQRERPDVVVAHHGIYAPQGIVAAVARARGIRLVTWNPAYRKHSFIFSHADTYHHTMMSEPVETWADRPLTPAERAEITAYLESRWHGAGDWIRFHKDPDLSLTGDLARLGLDPGKPLVVALTNVFWDAQLHYPANAFRTQRDWLVDTIAYVRDRPDLQLAIRVHPAEITGNPASRQLAQDEIRAAFPTLPPNVVVIPPSSALSTYDLAAKANAALIYATKMGVELSAVGIPVVVAGEAWVRNKGFTHDVSSRDNYREWLDRLPFAGRLAPELRERALAYAHHFFFGRMLPVESIVGGVGPRRFSVDAAGLDDLAPGASPGLDVICRGILTGSPFSMPRAENA